LNPNQVLPHRRNASPIIDHIDSTVRPPPFAATRNFNSSKINLDGNSIAVSLCEKALLIE